MACLRVKNAPFLPSTNCYHCTLHGPTPFQYDQIEGINRNKIEDYNQKYFLERTDGLLPAFETEASTLISARVQRE